MRQALAALHEVVLHKSSLHEQIRQRALAINVLRYRDTMQSLIEKDIEALVKLIEERSGFAGGQRSRTQTNVLAGGVSCFI